ncbi:hypothetical protein [Flavobacterium pedocola]
MKRLIVTALLFYYALGTFVLPMSDFSMVTKLPQMYANCKATEDCDMDTIDFVTDHLLNFDGLFDEHGQDDDQKPHQPFQNQTITFQLFAPVAFEFTLPKNNIPYIPKNKIPIISKNIVTDNFTSRKLRPPIV